MVLLGAAGLVPFLATAAGLFVFDDLLLAILCLLAGTLWGETLPAPLEGQGATILVSNGVVLFAVFAMLTAQPALAALLLMLGHLAQLWYERQSLRRPRWYVMLRTWLTGIAALSHLLFVAGLSARAAG